MVLAEDSSLLEDGLNSVFVDNLKVPLNKKKRVKSPTPCEASSTTPVHGRSQTPFSIYLNRHSEDPTVPTKWRSITPFIDRKDKERTPFELGKNIKAQLISHKMVFDKASVMDVSEIDFDPVRYITSELSVIDRACVMDVSNVEITYLVEEYDEDYTENENVENVEVEFESTKKKKGKKVRKSKSIDKEDCPIIGETKKKDKTGKKKLIQKKKREESRSPSPSPLPKLTLKLEIGAGSKMNKKMCEQKSIAESKPPPKKLKESLQSEGHLKEEVIQTEKSKTEIKSKSEQRELNCIENVEIENLEEIEQLQEQNETLLNLEITTNSETMAEQQNQDVSLQPEKQSIKIDGNNEILNEKQDENQLKIPDNVEVSKKSFPECIQKHEVPKKEKPIKKIVEAKEDVATKEQIDVCNKITVKEGERFMAKIKKFTQQKRNDPKNPCFINHLPNRTALEGQNLRLACSINGVDLTIKWFKNNNEIKSNEKYKIKENKKNNILSLEIVNCILSDTGEYSCVISNKQKRVISSCFVGIYDLSNLQDDPCPPNIELIEDSYHYLNDELMIECRVNGCPRPTLTWSRENYEIKKEHAIIEEAHGVHKMIIKHPCTNDTGIYVIKAVNSRGEHERKYCVEFFITTEKVIY